MDSLQWLALKARPDIGVATAICVSLQSRDPLQVVSITHELWRYLLGTRNLYKKKKKRIIPKPTERLVRVSADASFAPGGEKPRSDVAIRVFGTIVHWSSNKQALTAMSEDEVGLPSVVSGINV